MGGGNEGSRESGQQCVISNRFRRNTPGTPGEPLLPLTDHRCAYVSFAYRWSGVRLMEIDQEGLENSTNQNMSLRSADKQRGM